MKEAFIDWRPNARSRARLATIGGILKEYQADNITLTLRQLYYQLVSKDIIANDQREYQQLSVLLSKARLAGLVDWDCIEDRVRRAVEWQSYETVQECVDDAARSFALPRWADQPSYVELWCEKDALSSVLRPICDRLFATFMVNRGYSSSSAMYDAKNRIERLRKGKDGEARDVHVIYLGDFDPSGEDMVRDIRDRLATFGVEGIEVTKLALNPEQVAKWKLPPNPAKMKDSRAAAFVARHGKKSYEVDAIPPKDLQAMVKRAIESRMDLRKYRATLALEQLLRDELVKAVADIGK